VGLAAFAILRPGRDLKGVLYAKEIFVQSEERARGAGEALFAFLKAEAQRRGIGRIDLTTDPANSGAQRFYERLGGERAEKVAYRFWLE
jgi:GNAT superfamily N-acetyltransferase